MYTTEYAERPPREFLGAIGRAQSYLNIVYLLLSFPLGVFYFVFVMAGIWTGVGLLIVWLGIPILAFVLAACRALARGECQIANGLLGTCIPCSRSKNISLKHPWMSLKMLVGDGRTWSGVLFLVLKLPFGVFSFVLTISLFALTAALLLVPIAMRQVPIAIVGRPVQTGDMALLCFAAGLVLGIVSIYALNGVAAIWRVLARALLTIAEPSQAVPFKSGPVVIP